MSGGMQNRAPSLINPVKLKQIESKTKFNDIRMKPTQAITRKNDEGSTIMGNFSKAIVEKGLFRATLDNIKEAFNPGFDEKAAFNFATRELMADEGEWSFRLYKRYLIKLLKYYDDLYEGTYKSQMTWKVSKWYAKKFNDQDLTKGEVILMIRGHLRILDSMTNTELEYVNPNRFTDEELRTIRKASKCNAEVMDRMFLEHSALAVDRTWYFRRQELGYELPASDKEKRQVAMFDRPQDFRSQTYEGWKTAEKFKQQRYKAPYKRTWIYKHSSTLHDRWRSNVPAGRILSGRNKINRIVYWAPKRIPQHMRLSKQV